MQFTPQQLTGGARFQHTCRIGNWTEDYELEEAKLKDYLQKKEQGSLVVLAKQKQLQHSLQAQHLAVKARGNAEALRFGDTVMLLNHQSEAFLATDVHDKVSTKPYGAINVTTGPNSTPCSRNVVIVERAVRDDGYTGDEVHYGQELRFRLCPALVEAPMWLRSEPVSHMSASKFSRQQEVVFYANPDGHTKWSIAVPDPRVRFEFDGTVVPCNVPVVFKHTATGSFLASDKIAYMTMFGGECEVSCHAHFSTNKTHNLSSERKGEITSDYALRRHGTQNVWSVVTGHEAEDLGATADGLA